MAEYTPKEILDILFQKEDRITAGMATPPSQVAHDTLSSLQEIFTKATTVNKRDPRSLANAVEELAALGMDKDTIEMHAIHVVYYGQRILNQNAALAALANGVFSSSISQGLERHLGIKLSALDKIEQGQTIRQNGEDKLYNFLLQELTKAIATKPHLVQTNKERPVIIDQRPDAVQYSDTEPRGTLPEPQKNWLQRGWDFLMK